MPTLILKMEKTISVWSRLFDLIAPRACPVCGRRMSITEVALCGACNFTLPRTGYQKSPLDNELARLFWGRIPVEKCAAFFFYKPHSPSSHLIYKLKYYDHPEIGEDLGEMLAEEYLPSGFFDGITMILPTPLARKRIRQRGYNQSLEIAKGVAKVTGLPICEKTVRRRNFTESQTRKDRWQRNENVEKDFELLNTDILENQHVLLIDDVITTGATLSAFGKEIAKAKNVKISILALGFAKS